MDAAPVPIMCMVLTLYSNSENRSFAKKNLICVCCRSKQMPSTDQKNENTRDAAKQNYF